jgi:hypothetical protein
VLGSTMHSRANECNVRDLQRETEEKARQPETKLGTHHKSAWKHEHDIPPCPGSEERGDTKRVRGAEGGPRARRGRRIEKS